MATASAAQAQGLYADGLKRLPGVKGVETSPVQRLSAEARAWIDEERARQKARPGDPIALAVDINQTIGPAVEKLARRERVGSGDLILVIMYEITRGARDEVELDLRRMRNAGAAAADIEAAERRKAELDLKVAEVAQNQTVVSRTLIADLGGRR